MNAKLLFAPVIASTLLLGCGTSQHASDTGSGGVSPLAPNVQAGPPVVVGTVVEATSGAPVAGATIVGPDGIETVTDAEGRFRLKGMAPGASGDLKATAGLLEGSVRLRPLAGGRLEVVLHVR